MIVAARSELQVCSGSPPAAEEALSSSDLTLGKVIACCTGRWPKHRTENPIWGLIRIVLAQQVSTVVACQLAERVKSEYPSLLTPSPGIVPEPTALRALGVSQRRAECCAEIIKRSDELLDRVAGGSTWEEALTGIKGVGPWTIAVFRIMVMREPDVLPLGDVGLERAVANVYGSPQDVEKLSEKWRPYRSVACWYLWRTLGNQQLG